jgi:hypothetical protein
MKRKRMLATGLAVCLVGSIYAIPAFAGGNVGDIYSDTTQDLQRQYGESYIFKASGLADDDTYTVGNGKVLETFTKEAVSTALARADGKKMDQTTALYGFRCVGEGETGVYITHHGKTICLFKVKVNSTTAMAQAVGTDASKFSKVEVYHAGITKTIKTQSEMQKLLQGIGQVKLKRLPQNPNISGGEYAISFYPADGSAAYVYADGGSGNFSKRPGCTWNGPVGYYQIQTSSFDLWIKTMKEAFGAAK